VGQAKPKPALLTRPYSPAVPVCPVTFAEGPPRNRTMGVYAAMSVTGGVVGLIAGGLLTTYASWRWVLFVNVPIGIAGRPAQHAAAGPLSAAAYRHALATGFSRGFEVSAGILLLALTVTAAVIRVRRADLAGTPEPTSPGPASA
jgi:MFS family permease